MAVMSCCTGGCSFSVWRLVNSLQHLFCLVTLLFASSLSLISLIIVSRDVMKIITAENVTLILVFCVFATSKSVLHSHICDCVFYAMYAQSLSSHLCLSAVFDSILWVCGLYEFTMPSIPTVRNI